MEIYFLSVCCLCLYILLIKVFIDLTDIGHIKLRIVLKTFKDSIVVRIRKTINLFFTF